MLRMKIRMWILDNEENEEGEEKDEKNLLKKKERMKMN